MSALAGIPSPVIAAGADAAPQAIAALRARLAALERTAGTIGSGAITGDHISAGSIDTGHLQAGSITAELIQAGAIAAGHIAAGAIAAVHIQASTITGDKIAAGTLTAGNLAAHTITAGQVAASTITSTEIAATTITASDIAANTITASQIAAATITGDRIAATTIDGTNVKAGTLTATNIAASTITGTLLAATTITGDKIATGAITSTKINVANLEAVSSSMGTLTAGLIRIGAAAAAKVAIGQGISTSVGTKDGIVGTDASNAITFWADPATGNVEIKGTIKTGSTGLGNLAGTLDPATTIVDNTLPGAKVIANSITAAKIAAGTITATEIAGTTITAGKIASGTITATQLATGSVTADEIAGGAIDGKVITGATVRTAASGARVEMTTAGITQYNASSVATVTIPSDGSAASFAGVLKPSALEFAIGTVLEAASTTVNWKNGSVVEAGIGANGTGAADRVLYGHATSPAIGTTSRIMLGARPPIGAPGTEWQHGAGLSLQYLADQSTLAALAANNADATKGDAIFALTSDGPLSSEGQIRCYYQDNTGVIGDTTILDSAGRSSIPRVAGTLRKPRMNWGFSTINVAAADFGTLSVNHGLGQTPLLVVATATNLNYTAWADSYAASTFRLGISDIQKVVRTNAITVAWIAITDS